MPDILEPVTSTNEPAGPTVRSLLTRVPSARRGWPSAVAAIVDSSVATTGKVHFGLRVRQPTERGQRLDLAERAEPAAHLLARRALPSLQGGQHVDVPEEEGLHDRVREGARRDDQAAEAFQTAHLPIRGEPVRAQVGLQAREGSGSGNPAPSRMPNEAA